MRRVLRESDPFFEHHILASLLVEADLDFVVNHVVTLSGQVACTGTDLLSAKPMQTPTSQDAFCPAPAARGAAYSCGIVPKRRTRSAECRAPV